MKRSILSCSFVFVFLSLLVVSVQARRDADTGASVNRHPAPAETTVTAKFLTNAVFTSGKIVISATGFGTDTNENRAAIMAEMNLTGNLILQVNGMTFTYKNSGVQTTMTAQASDVDLSAAHRTLNRTWRRGATYYAIAAKSGTFTIDQPANCTMIAVEVDASGVGADRAERVLSQMLSKAVEQAVAQKFGTASNVTASGTVYMQDIVIDPLCGDENISITVKYAVFFD